MEDIGNLVLAERLRRGITQQELGDLLGLTRQRVALIEEGHDGVAAGTVLNCLVRLGITIHAVPSDARGRAETTIERRSPDRGTPG